MKHVYRWHINEPIHFEKDLKVTIQDLGWNTWGLYLAQKSDIACVVNGIREPHNPFPKITPERRANYKITKKLKY